MRGPGTATCASFETSNEAPSGPSERRAAGPRRPRPRPPGWRAIAPAGPLSHGPHEREPEPAAAEPGAPGLVCAGEPVERPREEVRRDAGTVVGDAQDQAVAGPPGRVPPAPRHPRCRRRPRSRPGCRRRGRRPRCRSRTGRRCRAHRRRSRCRGPRPRRGARARSTLPISSVTRSRAVVVGCGPSSSRRLSSSSVFASATRRPASTSAALSSRSSASASPDSRCASSSRAVSAASGVRSSWLASETICRSRAASARCRSMNALRVRASVIELVGRRADGQVPTAAARTDVLGGASQPTHRPERQRREQPRRPRERRDGQQHPDHQGPVDAFQGLLPGAAVVCGPDDERPAVVDDRGADDRDDPTVGVQAQRDLVVRDGLGQHPSDVGGQRVDDPAALGAPDADQDVLGRAVRRFVGVVPQVGDERGGVTRGQRPVRRERRLSDLQVQHAGHPGEHDGADEQTAQGDPRTDRQAPERPASRGDDGSSA